MSGESFGAMLRRFRERKTGRANGNRFVPVRLSISQGALARVVGIDPSYVALMERDRRNPTRDIVLSIADALDLSAREADQILYAAGLAPQADYQEMYEDCQRRLTAILDLAGGFGPVVTRDGARRGEEATS